MTLGFQPLNGFTPAPSLECMVQQALLGCLFILFAPNGAEGDGFHPLPHDSHFSLPCCTFRDFFVAAYTSEVFPDGF